MSALEWLDVAGDVATAVAALGVAYLVWQRIWREEGASEAVIAERVGAYQLNTLVRLTELAEEDATPIRDRLMSVRARTLPVDLTPLTLAALELPATDAARARVDKRRAEAGCAGTPVDAMRDEIRAELTAAIDSVLKRRSGEDED